MRARYGILLTMAAICLPLAVLVTPDGESRLQFDSSTDSISGSSQKLDERLMLLLQAPERLSATDIDLITELSLRTRLIPGVRKLHSIALAEVPFGTDESLELDTLPRRLQRDPDDADLWLDQAFNDPLLKGQLISADGRATRLVFETETSDKQDSLRLAREIDLAVRGLSEVDQRFDWWLTGAPLVRESISGLLLTQLKTVLPAVLLIFIVVLGVAFRSLTVIAACLVTLCIALLWTLAGAVLAGLSINLVTVLVPPLVLTLGLAFCMHVVSAFAEQGSLREGLESIRTPLLMSAATTAAGLAALAFNPVPAIQQFALLGVAGTLFATLAAVTIMPSLLTMMRTHPTLWPPIDTPMVRGANKVSGLVMRNSGRVIIAGLVLCAISLIGVFKVETGARYIRDLPDDSPVREAVEAINANFGGASGFDIHIEGAGRDAILLPDVLRAVEELQVWLNAQPGIGNSTSLVDYVKRVHQALTDGQTANYRIPDDAALIKQLLVFGGPDDIYDFTDLGFSRLRIRVVTPLDDTRELAALLSRVESRLAEMPPGIAPTISGDTVELVNTVERLTGGQLRAIGLAAASIFLALTIMFASLRVAAMAMLPNLLPVFVFFGLMGFTGTVLGPTTALVACIVLGIAVDDTLHLLGRFNRLAKLYADEQRACHDAVKEVIRPITLTTITISLGFLTLANSPFHSHAVFSLFAASTLVLAWASDLLIAPAVAVRAPIVTLWDRVRLDLGQDPEKTIPLFAGMSPRQARTFGLIATIRRVADGDTFITQGEEDDSMFVVLDGEVRIWLRDSHGQNVELSRLGRGVTIGEVGHFQKRRSANVSALGEVRLMQFDADTLERVLRRHPRIGGRAYQNLNRIQAEYQLNTMSRLTTAEPAPAA